MFLRTVTVISLAFCLAAAAQDETQAPENLEDRAAYTIGFDLGSNLSEAGIEPDIDLLMQGVKDALNEVENPLLSEQERQEAMQQFASIIQERQMAKRSEAGEANVAEGEEFFEELRENEGVEFTESGLAYEVLEEGGGPTPDANDTVKVHYEGRLIDGTVFDSSIQRGQPFELDGLIDAQGQPAVIQGWVEALQLMPEGAKWRLYIPSDLAYGARGAGQAIGPNQALIFDVELLEVTETE